MVKSAIVKICTCIFLLCLPLSTLQAAAGCCSHHGGVTGCNQSTNHQTCKDGTTSPTCLCSGGKSSAPVKSKSKTTTTTTTSTTAAGTTSPAVATPETEMKTSTTEVKTSTKGCCARHGGVAKCDKASGHQMCKDGTISSTCKC